MTTEYPTKPVKGSLLDGEMTLVGESGGLSAIYDCRPNTLVDGLLTVETEHGMLLLDPDTEHNVLDVDGTYQLLDHLREVHKVDERELQDATIDPHEGHAAEHRDRDDLDHEHDDEITVDEQAARSDDERFGPQDADLIADLPMHLRTLKSALDYRRSLAGATNLSPEEFERKAAEADRALTLHTGHHRVAAAKAAGLLDQQPEREPTAQDEAFWDQLEEWKRGGEQ